MFPWLWIPITIGAALAQTIRNATQRSLSGDLGMLGATLVRFLYGLPFAALWLLAVSGWHGFVLPRPNAVFLFWAVVGAFAQIAATAFLLQAMAMRNFAIGVAYSKTEVVQVALFGLVLLGERVSLAATLSIVLASAGVLLVSAPANARDVKAWFTPAGLYGLGSGAMLAISVVGYRAAALTIIEAGPALAAAFALVCAQSMQTLGLGGYLAWRKPAVVRLVFSTWRVSMLAGLMGALASTGWFTAFALEPAAHVRTLGLVELLFSYAISRRIFQERLGPAELVGMALLLVGVAGVTLTG
jgi:drug/metabolite transporter (DMT)-like permease